MFKPSSKPYGWPNSTKESIDVKPSRIISINNEQKYYFCNNIIVTHKYEWYSFLPLFLFEEFNPFTKLAHIYFLFVSILQTVPMITNTAGVPTVLIPLVQLLIIAASFKITDDVERHRADYEANSTATLVYDNNNNNFKKVTWADIEVGQFIKVQSSEIVPADVILLQVSEPNPDSHQGICYIETKSLDGETNLKTRSVTPEFFKKIKTTDDLKSLKGIISMEHPNNLISSFSADFIENSDDDAHPPQSLSSSSFHINQNHVVLRGCVLKSTDWLIGLVVNTGHDVKIMQSGAKIRQKTSSLDASATRQIMLVFGLLLLMCFVVATAQAIWNGKNNIKDHWYLDWSDLKPGPNWIIQFFYTLILHAENIPIPLYVSMQVVRFVQAYFMQRDISMYDTVTNQRARVRTMPLNEELGQISYMFCDKTGTLTQNYMNYRKCSINGIKYGTGITEVMRASMKVKGEVVSDDIEFAEEQAKLNTVPHVSFHDPKFDIDKEQSSHLREKIDQFYFYLSLCHEIIPEKLQDGTIKLSAPNPDDEALVCAASYFGYEFIDRVGKHAIIYDKSQDKNVQVEILCIIPFTSKRRRMSVVIRDSLTNKIKVITKGADIAIFSRLQKEDISSSSANNNLFLLTKSHIQEFSAEGLRCLVIGSVDIDENKFNDWLIKYHNACQDSLNIEKRISGEECEIDILEELIEIDLHLIGVTGIEDKLQDQVPECIEKFLIAGIKVWILTGDKEETAINIAIACNLILSSDQMEQVIVNSSTATSLDKLKEILTGDNSNDGFDGVYNNNNDDNNSKRSNGSKKSKALIVDGSSLLLIMKDKEIKKLFLQFSQTCKSVICCRMSPDQKREIVDLIKIGIPTSCTLAVGDGSNDVAMITTAHVGVGIYGVEGIQAVNASDYSIGQFKFLQSLLLKHGRYNYLRTSTMMSFIFYKSILNSFTLFWFICFCGVSGQKIYTEVSIQFYDIAFTSAPILFFASYDKDVDAEDVYKYPTLYTPGIKNENFTIRKFWGWVLDAIFESILCSILPIYFMTNFSYKTGNISSYFETSSVCCTAIIVTVNLKILTIQREWYIVSIIFLLLGQLWWFVLASVANTSTMIDYDFYGVWAEVISSGTFWLCVLLMITMLGMKNLGYSTIKRLYFPDQIAILQEISAYQVNGTQTTTNRFDGNQNQYEAVANPSKVIPKVQKSSRDDDHDDAVHSSVDDNA